MPARRPQARRRAPVPFYEMKSTSPVRELAPNDCPHHRVVTRHFQGDYAAWSAIARHALGVVLNEVRAARFEGDTGGHG